MEGSFARELSSLAREAREERCEDFKRWKSKCRQAAIKGEYTCVLIDKFWSKEVNRRRNRLLEDNAEAIELLAWHGIKVTAQSVAFKRSASSPPERQRVQLLAHWNKI